jgi:phage FluMu protein Com
MRLRCPHCHNASFRVSADGTLTLKCLACGNVEPIRSTIVNDVNPAMLSHTGLETARPTDRRRRDREIRSRLDLGRGEQVH